MRKPIATAATLILALTAVSTYLLSPAAIAQQQQQERQPANERGERFAEEFWQYLTEAQYRNWAPWPGQDMGFVPGQAPHGAKLKLYVNRTVAAGAEEVPEKAIIIKENFTPDEKLAAITIMYRPEREYDPEHGNWYWVKYNPDGTVATMNGNRLAGKVQSCIECHSTAQGDDFIFSNDEGAQEQGGGQQGQN